VNRDREPTLQRIRRSLAARGGFTLIEVLVVALITVVVAAAILTFLVSSLRQENQVTARAYSVQQAQAGLEQLQRDLSEAVGSQSVTLAQSGTATTISLTIPNAASADANESVIWTCPYSASPSAASAGACTRKVTYGSSSSTVTEMDAIESLDLAPQSPSGQPMTLPASDPAYVGITLYAEDHRQLSHNENLAQSGSKPIVLSGGVDLRNFQ
jgi:prepilin-type N-terminal cleavage/methylation domain-containing protein